VLIHGLHYLALVDTGSAASFIDKDIAHRLKLQKMPGSILISMASSSSQMHTSGFCYVDLTINQQNIRIRSFTYYRIYVYPSSWVETSCHNISQYNSIFLETESVWKFVSWTLCSSHQLDYLEIISQHPSCCYSVPPVLKTRL
jgi:hypothetical protein